MCMKYDLFCYAGKDVRMNLCNDEDIKAYKDQYTLFLNILWDYACYWEKWSESSGWGPYEDPDLLYSKNRRINPKFYSDLCDFLNLKEEGGKYTYTDNDKYINYKDAVKLVSDQLGFSAPSLELKHPYDRYLIMCKSEGKNKDEAINKVVNWVMESRTIGGSFLWPKDVWQGYNRARGGSKNMKGGSYIEDRVDLTLCEIKHYLNEEGNYEEENILYNYIEKDAMAKKWIKSFGDFKGYVDYFCFDPFVDKEKGYMPYDIVSNKKDCINDESERVYRDRKNNSIFYLSADDLETMFQNVNYMIKERSKMMIEMLNSKSSHFD